MMHTVVLLSLTTDTEAWPGDYMISCIHLIVCVYYEKSLHLLYGTLA